jgi:hypothetical protein
VNVFTVDDQGTTKAKEGGRGEDIFIVTELVANQQRQLALDSNVGEVAVGFQGEDGEWCGDQGAFGSFKADAIGGQPCTGGAGQLAESFDGQG